MTNPAKPQRSGDRALSVGEIAAELGCSKRTVQRYIKQGMPFGRGGKRGTLRFNRSKVLKWMRL